MKKNILARLVTVQPDGERIVDYLSVIIASAERPPLIFIETPKDLDALFPGQIRGIEIDIEAIRSVMPPPAEKLTGTGEKP